MQTGKLSGKFQLLPHAGQTEDLPWMTLALQQAEIAAAEGEVPIGAVLVLDGQAISVGHNAPISTNDACAHAEIQAIRQACATLGNYRLGPKATLYVTLQPCLMCVGAILHARIGRVVVGCAQSRYNGDFGQLLPVFEQAQAWHPCNFETGCMATECESVLTRFFQTRRKQREHAIAELATMMHLPNANKETIEQLAQLGFHSPQDFVSRGIEHVCNDLAAQRDALKESKNFQQAAILASLCDYFTGEPVRSWKQYL